MILAAREPHPLRNLAIGYGVMVPFQTFSVIADFLKNLVACAGRRCRSLAFSPWQREAIAFSYQFGTLILPTVAPAVFWVLLHRRFLEDFASGAPSPSHTEADYSTCLDAFVCARVRASTRRCTLPVVVMGNASMNSISFGYS